MGIIEVGICILGTVVLPIGLLFGALYIAVKVVNAVWRLFSGKPLFVDLETEGSGDPWYAGTDKIKETAEAAALRREKAREAEARIRERRRMDQLALSYYVRDASMAGRTQNEIRSALRQKGWLEEDVSAAFQACGIAIENI